jgi:hypothetical protein
MSIARDPVVDRSLESHDEDLAPIDVSYTKYQYERVAPQSGDVQNWSGGQQVTFAAPEYSDSVWDLKDSFAELRANVQIEFIYNTNTASNVGPIVVELSGYASACVEKFFMSGLFEDIQVYYGGTPVKQLECSNQLYPLLHSVYTLCSSDHTERFGIAESNNYTFLNDNPVQKGNAPSLVRDQYSQPRRTEVIRDAEYPYNECLDSFRNTGNIENWNGVPFLVQVNNTVGNQASAFFVPLNYSRGQQYRSALIHNPLNVQNPTGDTGTIGNSTFNPSTRNICFKLMIPFCQNNKKKPANIPLRFIFRRSKNLQAYVLGGDSQADALLSAGTDVGNTAGIIRSNYRIQFQEMNLYLKRLTLSENQKMVLYESPSMVYDMPAWTAQQFDITGTSFNRNVTFASLPELILVGLVPKKNILPYTAGINGVLNHFVKLGESVYHTQNNQNVAFSFLQMNSSYGRIPEDPYEPCQSNTEINTAQSLRAYRQWLKSLKSEVNAPVPFRTWLECHNWYAFILNTSNGNPHYTASRRERSTVNIVAQLVAGTTGEGPTTPEQNLQATSLVVIGMERNECLVTGLRNVTLVV